MPGISWATNH